MNEGYRSPDRIRVDFPDKMKVETPKTDRLIDSLIQAFGSLSKMLQESIREILDALQTLKHVPNLVRKFQEEVANQFTNLFTHQIEAQVLARHASILAAQKKRSAMESYQKEKMKQLSEDKNRITARYTQLLEKIAEECKSRVRRLDSHAFDIVEKCYPRQIQEKFSFDSMPAVEFLAAHADEAAEARALCLDEGLEFARAGMQKFLDQREAFYKDLDALVASGDFRPGWYEIPFLVIETEDVSTGETSFKVVPDPGVAEHMESHEDLAERLCSAAARQTSAYGRVPLTQEDRTALADAMCASFGVPEEERARFESGSIELLVPMEVK